MSREQAEVRPSATYDESGTLRPPPTIEDQFPLARTVETNTSFINPLRMKPFGMSAKVLQLPILLEENGTATQPCGVWHQECCWLCDITGGCAAGHGTLT